MANAVDNYWFIAFVIVFDIFLFCVEHTISSLISICISCKRLLIRTLHEPQIILRVLGSAPEVPVGEIDSKTDYKDNYDCDEWIDKLSLDTWAIVVASSIRATPALTLKRLASTNCACLVGAEEHSLGLVGIVQVASKCDAWHQYPK